MAILLCAQREGIIRCKECDVRRRDNLFSRNRQPVTLDVPEIKWHIVLRDEVLILFITVCLDVYKPVIRRRTWRMEDG